MTSTQAQIAEISQKFTTSVSLYAATDLPLATLVSEKWNKVSPVLKKCSKQIENFGGILPEIIEIGSLDVADALASQFNKDRSLASLGKELLLQAGANPEVARDFGERDNCQNLAKLCLTQ